jgi:hypothetical protein
MRLRLLSVEANLEEQDLVVRIRTRLAAAPAIVALAAAVIAVPATGAAATKHKTPTVKAPRSGKYTGAHGRTVLYISGRSIDLIGFDFPCGQASGSTSLNSIKLKKTRKGYAFSIRAHGSVTYSDAHPDENAAVDVSGRFTRDGKRVAGQFRVKAPRCRDTGAVKWSAKR